MLYIDIKRNLVHCGVIGSSGYLTAVNIYNIAGQRAEKACEGPGSFQVHFLDELYRSTPDDVAGSLFDMA